MLRVVTFNAGLAVGLLPYTAERAPHVVSAVAALEADLVFVQEFWLDSHWERLRSACEARRPHAFRPEPVQPAEHGACTKEEVAPLVGCAQKHCDGLESDALARCVVSHCASAAMSMSPGCVNCIARHPAGNLQSIVSPCIGDDHPRKSSPSGVSRGRAPHGLVAYGGSFGTGLLSRLPLLDRDVLVFHATVNARCAIHARVDHPDFEPIHLFGTHLSPMGGEEKRAQVDALLAWIDEKAKRETAIVTGDLNLDTSDCQYRRFETAGFRNAFGNDEFGTYAHSGLTHGTVSDSGWTIDHVLLRGDQFDLSAERVLDTPLTIEVEGLTVRTTLSDHLGVRATITRTRRPS